MISMLVYLLKPALLSPQLGWQGNARDGIDAIPERDGSSRARPTIDPPSPPSKLPAKVLFNFIYGLIVCPRCDIVNVVHGSMLLLLEWVKYFWGLRLISNQTMTDMSDDWTMYYL